MATSFATTPKLKATIDQVILALQQWPDIATQAGVRPEQIDKIQRSIDAQVSV
jgi:hypothetical protein